MHCKKKEDESGKGGRMEEKAKIHGGFTEFAVPALPPNPQPRPYPSFQSEQPESDSTKPPVRHWETATLQPAIETRGFSARSMMRQK